jgi:Putative phage abortive infection protein
MTIKHEELPGKRWIVVIFATVVITWVASPLILWGVSDPAERGQFGDQYGALNALFSGLAFAGLIITLFMQRQELRLQREELAATRGELAGSKEHLKAQSESLQKQNFETTFFEMIRLHHVIVDGMVIRRGSSEVYTGREAINLIFSELKHRGETTLGGAGEYKIAIHQCLANHKGTANHYISNFYCILNYIRSYGYPRKSLYVDILLTQLSINEIFSLFYSTVFFQDDDRWSLAGGYSLFDDIDRHRLIKMDYDWQEYQAMGQFVNRRTG